MNPKPQFVLLPGLHGSDELWQPLLDVAPHDVQLVPVSYPSKVPSRYSSLEDHVRGILPTTATYVLVAESFSGPVAIRIAASPPKNMSALVLCNSFAAPPSSLAWARFPWKTLFRIPGPSPIIRHYFVGRSASASQVRHVRKIVLGSNPVVLASRARLMFTADALEHLSQIDLPVLYIRGTEDRLVSDRALQTIRDVLPSIEISFVVAPHFTLQMAPADAWHAIERFIENSAVT